MQRRRAVSRKQNRRVHALITLIFCIAVFILVCAGCFLLVKTDGTITNKPNQSQGDSSSAAPDGADSTTDGDSQQEQPTMTEEEQRIADATATASANCTKDAPQVVDPALWDERGKALMEQLAADEFYQSEGLKYSAKDGCPYMIAVNRAASTVTVLALDDEGNYTKPYMAMVCSGDAGVYGMASPLLELAAEYPDVEVEVVPGLTAALSGAAVLGAPLAHDFCVISLSDRLTPWEMIEKRLACAAMGDFCVALYNPSSKGRPDYLQKAVRILLQNGKGAGTLCGVVRSIGRTGQQSSQMTLAELEHTTVDMFTTVFIGNSATHQVSGWMVTPRGYHGV